MTFLVAAAALLAALFAGAVIAPVSFHDRTVTERRCVAETEDEG
jgi:hypothetical protein